MLSKTFTAILAECVHLKSPFFSLSLSSFALLHLLECLTNSDTEHEHLKSATHTKRKNNFDQNTKYLMTQRKIYKAKAKATFIEEEIENR